MTQLTTPTTPSPPPSSTTPSSVDILILGAGWTSTFLIPLLTEKKHHLRSHHTQRPRQHHPLHFQSLFHRQISIRKITHRKNHPNNLPPQRHRAI
ncbi:hypothetical protein JMJ35_009050 [Cladonia borealis]|uniref:Uncharacterized protein n=1 Tax=Cladonia borealis TaxID=184061 RepID=A0AA39QVM9_9LECA|nr:hypothetical protein JMJ35_009050 [Cladonia borealis]